MKYVYKTIPTHPQFEICDEADLKHVIRTVDTKEYLNVYLNNKGYPRTTLKKTLGGDGKLYTIHHLIVETYIGKIPKGMEIDHVNRTVGDFRHTNLRICSHKENMNNPLTLIHKSEIRKNYLEEHPEIIKELSKKHKEYFSNPENRKKHSDLKKKYYKDHPEIIKERSEKIKEYWTNPENRKKHSDLKKNYLEEHPEILENLSKKHKEYFSNPENRKKASEITKQYYREHPEILKQKAEKTMIPVLQIDKDTGNIINEYPSLKEAGLRTGIRHICECCKGKYKQAGGFIWKYKD